MARCEMTVRHANRVLAGTIALAIGAAMAVPPAQADSVAQSPNPLATDASRAAPKAPPVMPTGNPLWTIPLSQLAVTPDRPLFSPSRRPPAPGGGGSDLRPAPGPPHRQSRAGTPAAHPGGHDRGREG